MSFTEISKDLSTLKGKTVVLTGGASGIGAAIVKLAANSGAHVVFGDLNVDLGQQVAAETGAIFVRGDASKYADLLGLFQEAYEKFGAVDHAIANAGIFEPRQDFFDAALDLESVKEAPSTLVYDINIRGTTYFSRIASVYLRQNRKSEDNKSLTLISSTAGLLSTPDIPLYSTTKSGILGLTRSLAQRLPASHNIRVNAVCPSYTQTPLAAATIAPVLAKIPLPINEPSDIADVVCWLACESEANRKILWVEAATSWDVEEPLLRLLPEWVGEGPWEMIKAMKKLRSEAAKA
ncbi:hypothetical protein NX059_011469 [Plenodomus lindquistii]|nr:hypothetical protein NX059_011469 [Plenodomus lindquistii]